MTIFDFMNSVSYLAQVGHFAFAYAVIITVMAISLIRDWNWWPTIGTAIIGMILAGLKEFWFDANYELPKQTFGDNLMDFSFYFLGAAIGMFVSYLLVKNLVRKVPVITV